MLLTACTAQGAGTSAVTVATGTDAGQDETESDAATSGAQMPSGPPCKVSESWLQPHKMCKADSDCTTVNYRTSCCATEQVVGVNHMDVDQVQACADNAPPICMAADSCNGMESRAEDGRSPNADLTNVAASCIDNICQSKVTTRSCGTASCQADELCVVYQNTAGTQSDGTGNALFGYACLKNPCQQQLDCTCAQTLCDARADVVRTCSVKFATANEGDIFCTPEAD